MQSKVWLKKYLIVLNGSGYAITASCATREKLPVSEKTWDGIAASLRLLNPIDDSIAVRNNTPRARRTIEQMRVILETRLKQGKHK